jgi:hypothetical protein
LRCLHPQWWSPATTSDAFSAISPMSIFMIDQRFLVHLKSDPLRTCCLEALSL